MEETNLIEFKRDKINEGRCFSYISSGKTLYNVEGSIAVLCLKPEQALFSSWVVGEGSECRAKTRAEFRFVLLSRTVVVWAGEWSAALQ